LRFDHDRKDGIGMTEKHDHVGRNSTGIVCVKSAVRSLWRGAIGNRHPRFGEQQRDRLGVLAKDLEDVLVGFSTA